MKNLVTIIAEVVNFNQIEGTESLSYNVRVATCIDDWSPKYSYTMWSKEKAIKLAEKIHRDQRTQDIVWINA